VPKGAVEHSPVGTPPRTAAEHLGEAAEHLGEAAEHLGEAAEHLGTAARAGIAAKTMLRDQINRTVGLIQQGQQFLRRDELDLLWQY